MNHYSGKGRRYNLYCNIINLDSYNVQRSNLYRNIINHDSCKTLMKLVNDINNHNIDQSSGKTQTVLVNNITQYV